MNCAKEENSQKIRLSEKLVVIINGKGGAGKDTVCEIAEKHYRAKTISAITPVKEIARQCGWNGEKDNRARKFLSDLKRLLVEYNNLPNKYLECEYKDFIKSDYDLLFVHIRESDQIDEFKSKVSSRCVALIVRSSISDSPDAAFGNTSDDDVEKYMYDYAFQNGKPLDSLAGDFIAFLQELFSFEGISEG
ncbi:MAG: hypothetical protein FWB97_08345 [Oscillospiraceae bacterium]|nr:hypothetical protein [Oscillospiraceae bacterium]